MEIEQAPFLEGVDPEVLARIREAATVKNYLGNGLIYDEGDPAQDFYMLRDGKVLITSTLAKEPHSAIRITQVEPGETFGWAALAGVELLNTRAQALDDSSAYAIPARTLQAILREHPVAGYEIMTRLFERILMRLRETRDELRWLKQRAK